MKTVAEFTIREVEENGKCRVQYIANGEVMLEGKDYPHNQWGHPYYCDMVKMVLEQINKGKQNESKT